MREAFVEVWFHRLKDDIDVGFNRISRHKGSSKVLSCPTLEFVSDDSGTDFTAGRDSKTQLTYRVLLIIQKQPFCRPVFFSRLFEREKFRTSLYTVWRTIFHL